jgi:hypothetical protein
MTFETVCELKSQHTVDVQYMLYCISMCSQHLSTLERSIIWQGSGPMDRIRIWIQS